MYYKTSKIYLYSFTILLINALTVFINPINIYSLQVPPLKGYVNDYADMISPMVEKQIEKELEEFEKSESTQIVILTIPSLEGEVLEDFSIKVADEWKIGQRFKDNGVILLVAKNERKIRIEVGRGLEGRLTDLLAGRIIDLVITPRFKRGDFDGGFLAGISALIDATRGEFKSEDNQNKDYVPTHLLLLIPVILFFWLTLIRLFYKLSFLLGGLTGAIGLPLIIYIIGIPLMLKGVLISMFIGFILGISFPRLSLYRSSGYSIFYGPKGSWGSRSFGGFSGGGGSFGGGGASGSW